MYGYSGKILVANLENENTRTMDLDSDYGEMFIGGGGLACRILYDIIDFSVDPLSPDNPLLFMTGPLTGTLAPCTGRHVVCAKSPLTGFWGEANAGGHFGAQLKFSGYDGILVKGKARKPTVLHIGDRDVEFIDGTHLWGLTTDSTQEVLKKDLGRIRVSCIGPAGENLVRFASIVNEERVAARCGLGAVMGSKKLKAIAVSGSGSVTLKDPDAFNELARQSSKTLAEVLPMLREQGTALYVDVSMMFNDMPIKYFQEIEFDVDPLNSTAMEAFLTGRIACYSCPIGCGRKVSVPDCGLDNVAGPEFQTIAAFGTNLMISDLQSIMLMNRLCNQYGMDTISCGSTIAFAVHLCDHGKADFSLKWGDPERTIQLIHDIANRKQLGKILADGAWRLAQAHDAEDLVLHVKGLEVPNHDPRAFSGMATIYAIASRGATHLEGDMYSVDMGADTRELGIISGDRLENEGKGIIAAKAQDYRAFFDTLIMCHFALVPPENIMKLLNLATGYSLSEKDSLMIGARAVTLKRLFNLKCGLKPEQDTIPAPLLKPQPDSVTEDFTPDLEMQLKDYYDYRKWDRKTGEPSIEALEKLGLTF